MTSPDLLAVVMEDDVVVPLGDGTRLFARLWRPAESAVHPVPAILEYLPYRRRDGTCERDALTHPYIAARGYACIRVDMRGSGDSDGVLLGEYLPQEQDDALEIIGWLARQPWCSGEVGMIGISWGGFNGLQVAARQPPALKAVISLCSTDDRYSDDIHFMGGALLTDKMTWADTMLSISASPPDPAVVGERWRAMWCRRLDEQGLWMAEWLRHQRRDAFYRHGSICEDWAAVRIPVYAVGGWIDGYSNAIFRMLQNLPGPTKALVGPWAHKYPHFAKPEPTIGFLQECLRWWDHHLKGRDTGIADEPPLRVWINDSAPPRSHVDVQPGRWVSEPSWPSPNVAPSRWALAPGRLARVGGTEAMRIRSPQTVGLASGNWCPYGVGHDAPLDQRMEAGGSLLFDSPVLDAPLEMLGRPVVALGVASDQPQAHLVCVLSEVRADGSVTRLSYGVLNLTHRDSHSAPTPLVPGETYRVQMGLNELGHRLPAGSRVRLAISTSYWPTLWPAPVAATLTLDADGTLDLPCRVAAGAAPPDFPPAETAPPLARTQLRPGHEKRRIETDIVTGIVTKIRDQDAGAWRLDDIDLVLTQSGTERQSIHPDDPLSARHEAGWDRSFTRGAWNVATRGGMTMTADRTHFHLAAYLQAFEGDGIVFERRWNEAIPRDLV